MRLVHLAACTILVGCSAAASKDDGDSPLGHDGAIDPRIDTGVVSTGDEGGLNTDAVTTVPDALDEDSACASESHKGERTPLDLYILMDQSGSMKDSGKWTSVKSAIAGFVAAKDSAGIGVGIQYFPIPDSGTGLDACLAKCLDCTCAKACGCVGGCSTITSGGVTKVSCTAGGTSCKVADYATPDVAIAVLPGVAPAINASMDKHGPSGSTPTRPALEGATSYAKAFVAKNPTHKVVIVLATDGVPSSSECTPNAVSDVVKIATDADSGAPPIQTYVIGVGKDLVDLDAVAVAGGTKKAFLVDTATDAGKAFLDAMNAIRSSSLSCDYLLPLPKTGEKLDYAKVNVTFKDKDGKTATLPQVADKTKCDPAAGGWYYDNPSAPTRIEICPASCDAFSAAGSFGEVQILLGCKTVVAK